MPNNFSRPAHLKANHNQRLTSTLSNLPGRAVFFLRGSGGSPRSMINSGQNTVSGKDFTLLQGQGCNPRPQTINIYRTKLFVIEITVETTVFSCRDKFPLEARELIYIIDVAAINANKVIHVICVAKSLLRPDIDGGS